MPEVLFVCVHNAGRSQMASALVTLRSNDRIGVLSAGSEPAAELNPTVVEAMREIGVDLGGAFPKELTDDAVRTADVVIMPPTSPSSAARASSRLPNAYATNMMFAIGTIEARLLGA